MKGETMMKTIQELYDEVMASEALKAQCIEAVNAGRQEQFLREHGCEATPEEVTAFLKEKAEEDAPLSVGELENAAGGGCKTATEGVVSMISAGLACAAWAIASASMKNRHVGQNNESEGRLCNED